MKLLIWTSIPTHHQSAFFAALRDQGIDVVVHYYHRLPPSRLHLGWSAPSTLPRGERYVAAAATSLSLCPDWRERIHVLPGYARTFSLALALRLSVQCVPWVHWSEPSNPTNNWQWAKDVVRSLYAWMINRRALGALAMGEMAQHDFLRWGVYPDRIRVVPYSIPPVTAPAVTTRKGAGAIRFLFLGERCERKGVDVLLQAFAEVQKRSQAAELILVGHDASGGYYERLAAELRLSAATFCSSVPADDVGAVIAGCDVLVLPSRFDGWGMVLSEGASMQRALIASDACGAAYHVIEDGVAGFRVPAGDAGALARAMTVYCQSPTLVKEHGAASRALFEGLLPSVNALRMRRAIEELSARAAGRRHSMRLT
jgi:glycosyltransferase involved in cell wall biosynthesis